MNTTNEITALAENYITVWNEPDGAQRQARIRQLWAENGSHFSPSMEAHGYPALEFRIATAYQKWVKDAGYRFKYSGNAQSHHNGVRFNWEMVSAENKTLSAGFDFLLLDEDGRIRSDHQFLDPTPA